MLTSLNFGTIYTLSGNGNIHDGLDTLSRHFKDNDIPASYGSNKVYTGTDIGGSTGLDRTPKANEEDVFEKFSEVSGISIQKSS